MPPAQPGARLICLDIQPYATNRAPERENILNIGGSNDNLSPMIAARHGTKELTWGFSIN